MKCNEVRKVQHKNIQIKHDSFSQNVQTKQNDKMHPVIWYHIRIQLLEYHTTQLQAILDIIW